MRSLILFPSSFDPEHLAAMSQAYEMVCIKLGLRQGSHHLKA